MKSREEIEEASRLIAAEIESTDADPGGALSGENRLLAGVAYSTLKWILEEPSPFADSFINLLEHLKLARKIGYEPR